MREVAYHIPEGVIEYVTGLAPGPPPWNEVFHSEREGPEAEAAQDAEFQEALREVRKWQLIYLRMLPQAPNDQQTLEQDDNALEEVGLEAEEVEEPMEEEVEREVARHLMRSRRRRGWRRSRQVQRSWRRLPGLWRMHCAKPFVCRVQGDLTLQQVPREPASARP